MENEIKITLDAVHFAATTILSTMNDETFNLIIASGNQGRCYVLTPKHAKRLLLLLQQQISEYESKFGELQTALPVATPGQTEEKKMGFSLE